MPPLKSSAALGVSDGPASGTQARHACWRNADRTSVREVSRKLCHSEKTVVVIVVILRRESALMW